MDLSNLLWGLVYGLWNVLLWIVVSLLIITLILFLIIRLREWIGGLIK